MVGHSQTSQSVCHHPPHPLSETDLRSGNEVTINLHDKALCAQTSHLH